MEDLFSIFKNLECWQLINFQIIFDVVLTMVKINNAVVSIVQSMLLYKSLKWLFHRTTKSAPLGFHHHYNILVCFQAFVDMSFVFDFYHHLLDLGFGLKLFRCCCFGHFVLGANVHFFGLLDIWLNNIWFTVSFSST